MKRRLPFENTPRVIAVALVLAAAGAALAVAEGLYAKFSAEELAVFAIFAVAFAALTYGVDARVRAAIRGWFGLERRDAARARASHKRLGGDLA
jgi:hypothetical protein